MESVDHARAWLPELVVLTAAAALYFAGLGGDAMRDWDEATYAAVAREMRAAGDLLTPQIDGRPYNKPPLVFWLIAASQAALGDSELAARWGAGRRARRCRAGRGRSRGRRTPAVPRWRWRRSTRGGRW